MMKKLLLLPLFFSIIFNVSSITPSKDWKREFGNERSFIENKGQYNVRHPHLANQDIKYSYDEQQKQIHFTPSGVIYHFYDMEKNPKRPKGNRTMPRYLSEQDIIAFEWVGANKNVQIEAHDKQIFYSNFSTYDGGKDKVKSFEKLSNFKKIIYKNLYNGIDVVYEIHPQQDIKYSLIVKAGADISQVKMRYANDRQLVITSDGKLAISTKFGDIVEQAPISFYTSNQKSTISSGFVLKNNEVSFRLSNFDKTKNITIDPWVQTPNFNTGWKCVWECETDAAGNSYLIGGVMPMQLLKYNTAGVLQWTYTTPYDTSNTWLGNFATDDAGNSYVTEGTGGGIQKISTLGSLTWNSNNATVGGLLTEFWAISFNCDQTKLVIGGTGGALSPTPYMFDVNPNNGSVSSSVKVTEGNSNLFGGTPQEVRAVASCGNGKYYFLSHDSIGYIHQSLTSCLPSGSLPFHVNNSYAFGYKCENFRRDNTGIAAMKYKDGFVYIHRGNRLDKRDFNTAAIFQSVNIPGGQFNSGGFGAGNSVGASGIDIDDCGNIYVGATNGVVKFNSNLVQQAIYSTSFVVYDVAVGTGGEITAAGSTGTSGSGNRTGSIQSFSASACTKVAPFCCDATICQVPPKCTTDPAVTLTPTTPGGTFSGPGVVGNTFNPSIAGIGTHTIRYTLACGSDSIRIVVNSCTATSVCRENNGNLTVSGGTGPYTWFRWQPAQTTTVTNAATCTQCGGTWTPFVNQCLNGIIPVTSCSTPAQWVQFGTGATVTPPAGQDSVRVVDNSGTALVVRIATLPLCNPVCNLSLSITSSLTQCQGNNGTITVTPSGGTTPYSYVWSPNVSTTNSATGLSAGTYRVTVNAGTGCSRDTTITLTAPNAPQIQWDSVWHETCLGQNNGGIRISAVASALYTLFRAPLSNPTNETNNGTQNNFLNLAPGTYIIGIRDNNGCVDTIIRTINPGINCCNLNFQNIATAQPTCGQSNGSITLTMTGGTLPYSYTWSPNVSTTNAASNLSPNTYRVTVTAGAGCSRDTLITILSSTSPIIASVNTTAEVCSGQNNGLLNSASTSGGTGQLTYNYAPVSNPLAVTAISSFPVNNLAPGTYILGVQDANSCRDTIWFTIGAGPNCCNLSFQNIATTQPTCGQSNGSITLTMAGGTLPYSYTWSPNVSTTNTATNLAPNTYRVTVSAGVGCSRDTVITLNSNSNLAISITNVVNPTCVGNNGSLTAGFSGGTAPYTITIDTGGTPIIFSGIPFPVSQPVTGLPADTVRIKVTDGQNCEANQVVVLTAPNLPTISNFQVINEQCLNAADGQLTGATATGGSGSGYSYSYATISNPTNFTPIASFPLTGLAAGSYILRVVDGAGCQDTVLFSIAAGPLCCNLSLSAILTAPGCGLSNGAINVTMTQGSGNYSFSWSPGGQATEDISNVIAGNYFLTVNDLTQGCSLDTNFVLSNPNAPIINNVQVIKEQCAGNNNGSITVTASGGTGQLNYTWSPALPNSASQTNLSPGPYSFTITDANNCVVSGSRTVLAGTRPDASGVVTNPSCNNNDGQIAISVVPTGSYQYVLSSGAQNTNGQFAGLPQGPYQVFVIDGNGCRDTVSLNLVASGPILSTISSQNVSCFGANDGSIAISNVLPSYQYSWSAQGLQGPSVNGLAPNTYTVTISDGLGCSLVLSATITSPAPIVVSLGRDTAFCGTSFRINAGNPGLSFAWSTTEQVQEITVINSGTYTVTVSDTNGCSAVDSINVQIFPPVSISLRRDTTIFEGVSVVLTSIVNGGSGVGNYVWTPTEFLSCSNCQTPISTPNDTIAYFVRYIDSVGCVATDLINIYIDEEFAFNYPNAFTPNGDSNNDSYLVFGRGVETVRFSIFNRWGEKVFESNSMTQGWDGKYKGEMQPPGVYVLSAQATFFNGKTIRRMGSVTLIR